MWHEGKVLFVCVDSSEDTYLYIADEADVDAFYEEHPDADRFEVATSVGRELTEDEALKLRQSVPEILGGLCY